MSLPPSSAQNSLLSWLSEVVGALFTPFPKESLLAPARSAAEHDLMWTLEALERHSSTRTTGRRGR